MASPLVKGDEAVGTLLVHQSDMMELGAASGGVKVAVGSLLLPTEHPKSVEENDEIKNQQPNVMRRMSKTLTGPAPEGPEYWAD